MSTRMIAALLMTFAIPALAADTTVDQQEAAAALQKRAAVRKGEGTVKASSPSVPSDDSKMKPGEVTPPKPDQAQGSVTGM
jgi:hypothetical protein